MKQARLYPEIRAFVDSCLGQMGIIPQERRSALEELASHINERLSQQLKAELMFICTHNSRRSHFGQIWAAVAAHYFQVENVVSYSGGTEATAFHPNAVASLERTGFRIDNPGRSNPHYLLSYAKEVPAIRCFSKTYDDAFNPQTAFAAIMTCSDADENCPFIPGADLRVKLTYEDPKVSDGSPEETKTYNERSRQIATEMLYLFSKV